MPGAGQVLKRAWWWQAALPAVLTAGAWLTQVLVSAALPYWARLSLIAGGTLSAVLAFLLPTRQIAIERQNRVDAERLASEAVAAYKVRIHDMLIPLALALSNAVSAPSASQRREAQQTLRQMVIDFAQDIGPDRSRACFYMLSGSKPHRSLELKNWSGRNRPPRDRFVEGTSAGALAMRLVDSLDARLVKDVDQAGLLGWTSGQAEYRTFICASVFTNRRPLGILTVDSLVPGDLTESDLDLLRLFAQMLGSGIACGR